MFYHEGKEDQSEIKIDDIFVRVSRDDIEAVKVIEILNSILCVVGVEKKGDEWQVKGYWGGEISWLTPGRLSQNYQRYDEAKTSASSKQSKRWRKRGLLPPIRTEIK